MYYGLHFLQPSIPLQDSWQQVGYRQGHAFENPPHEMTLRATEPIPGGFFFARTIPGSTEERIAGLLFCTADPNVVYVVAAGAMPLEFRALLVPYDGMTEFITDAFPRLSFPALSPLPSAALKRKRAATPDDDDNSGDSGSEQEFVVTLDTRRYRDLFYVSLLALINERMLALGARPLGRYGDTLQPVYHDHDHAFAEFQDIIQAIHLQLSIWGPGAQTRETAGRVLAAMVERTVDFLDRITVGRNARNGRTRVFALAETATRSLRSQFPPVEWADDVYLATALMRTVFSDDDDGLHLSSVLPALLNRDIVCPLSLEKKADRDMCSLSCGHRISKAAADIFYHGKDNVQCPLCMKKDVTLRSGVAHNLCRVLPSDELRPDNPVLDRRSRYLARYHEILAAQIRSHVLIADTDRGSVSEGFYDMDGRRTRLFLLDDAGGFSRNAVAEYRETHPQVQRVRVLVFGLPAATAELRENVDALLSEPPHNSVVWQEGFDFAEVAPETIVYTVIPGDLDRERLLHAARETHAADTVTGTVSFAILIGQQTASVLAVIEALGVEGGAIVRINTGFGQMDHAAMAVRMMQNALARNATAPVSSASKGKGPAKKQSVVPVDPYAGRADRAGPSNWAPPAVVTVPIPSDVIVISDDKQIKERDTAESPALARNATVPASSANKGKGPAKKQTVAHHLLLDPYAGQPDRAGPSHRAPHDGVVVISDDDEEQVEEKGTAESPQYDPRSPVYTPQVPPLSPQYHPGSPVYTPHGPVGVQPVFAARVRHDNDTGAQPSAVQSSDAQLRADRIAAAEFEVFKLFRHSLGFPPF